MISHNGKNSLVNSSSSTSSIPIVNNSISNGSQNGLLNSRMESTNQRIIETRVDPNEIIREIENELSSRLNRNKDIS